MNSRYSPIYLPNFSEIGSIGPRYEAIKSNTSAKIYPYEFIHGQVSPRPLCAAIFFLKYLEIKKKKKEKKKQSVVYFLISETTNRDNSVAFNQPERPIVKWIIIIF